MTSEPTIPLIYGRVIIAAASRTSADSRRMLAGTDIDLKLDAQWDAGITLEDYRALLRNAVSVSGNPTVLLDAGVGTPLPAHGLLANAIGCSPDRLAIIELMTRFIKLRGFFCNIKLEQGTHKTRVYIDISEDVGTERETALDFILGAMVHSVLLGEMVPLADLRIDLKRSRPAEYEHYRQVLGASINYNSSENFITFDTGDLRRPLPAYNPEQFEIAVRKCQSLLVDGPRYSTRREAVERIFERSPGMLWTLDQVSRALHTSSRTLQRHLKQEGISYQAVLDYWLKQLATKYLEEEKLSAEATATLLGYTDEANFRRAFKRWQGCSPREYRERQVGAAAEFDLT
jgi:AraC-like DNA-binding protein